eukprot:5187886-Pleurochrysis_carterae.AAC.1
MPGKPPLGLQYGALHKGPGPMSVPGSKTNLGGERGVKYCLPGFNAEFMLRSPPVPNGTHTWCRKDTLADSRKVWPTSNSTS